MKVAGGDRLLNGKGTLLIQRLQLWSAIVQQDHFVLWPQLLPDDIRQPLVIGLQVLCIGDANVHRRGFFILGDPEFIDSRHLGGLLVQAILKTFPGASIDAVRELAAESPPATDMTAGAAAEGEFTSGDDEP